MVGGNLCYVIICNNLQVTSHQGDFKFQSLQAYSGAQVLVKGDVVIGTDGV